jgi:hypothetical protein
MKKYTDIGQFRNVVDAIQSTHDYIGKDSEGKAMFQHTSPYPTVKFKATVKTHGSNCSICKYKDGTYTFQSRESELTLLEDNLQFMNTMQLKDYKKLFENIEFENYCCIYGEWVGKKIQSKVAVSKIERTFIIFAIKIDDKYKNIADYPQLSLHSDRIYNTLEFPNWDIEIDFNKPEEESNRLMNMVLEIEKECPVGKSLGVIGIGEGLVFEHNEKLRYIFKLKGDKHAGKSKIKIPRIINEEDKEKEKVINIVIKQITPIWRLAQMLESTFNINNGGRITRDKLGDYIKNVLNDIIKEEMDIITKNNLTLKELTKPISNIARLYFFEQENKY